MLRAERCSNDQIKGVYGKLLALLGRLALHTNHTLDLHGVTILLLCKLAKILDRYGWIWENALARVVIVFVAKAIMDQTTICKAS